MAYRILVQPVDNSMLAAAGVLKTITQGNGVPTAELGFVVKADNDQIKHLLDYCSHINHGTDTSSVEAAIGALPVS